MADAHPIAELVVELLYGSARMLGTSGPDDGDWVFDAARDRVPFDAAFTSAMAAHDVDAATIWSELAHHDLTARVLAALWGPPEHFEQLLEPVWPQTAVCRAIHLAIVHNPAATAEIISEVVPNHGWAHVDEVAVRHPNCGAGTLIDLAGAFANIYAPAIVEHPNCTLEVLEAVVAGGRFGPFIDSVHERIAELRNCGTTPAATPA